MMAITIGEIKNIIIKVDAEAKVDLLDGDTDFEECGIDSLEEFNIFLEVEEAFGVAVPDEIADQIRTINSLIKYIEENK